VRVELQRGVRGGALVGVVRDALLRRWVNLWEIKIQISKVYHQITSPKLKIRIRKYIESSLC